MSRSLLAVALAAVSAGSPGDSGAPVSAGAAEDPFVLVELFTSEGCSSCPPADALLAEIGAGGAARTRTVTLSEHVDYWDHLGWRDPFSSPVFTRRQEVYSERFRLSAVYTPQLVISGRIQVLGSDREAALAAIAAAAREPAGRVTARITSRAPGDLSIAAEARWRDGVRADVLVALVQGGATTRVAHGENAGRTLHHVSVVRSLSSMGSGVGAFSGRATLRMADAALVDRLVVFVQEPGQGPVQAATVLALP